MQGIFVTGTDTDVGKTTVCAGLMKLMQGTRRVRYWKPVQTGTIVGDDTNELRTLTEMGAEFFVDPCYRFPEPLSPHMAARKWGKTIDLDAIMSVWRGLGEGFTVVEGAGGVLVPLNDSRLQIDLIHMLKLPVLVIAEDRVGSINHSLLTLKALQDAKIPVLGVVLSKARGILGTSESIQQFGKTEVLAEIPPSEDARTTIAQVGSHPRLRTVFNVPQLP